EHRHGGGAIGGGAGETCLGIAEARAGLAVAAGSGGFALVSDAENFPAGGDRGLASADRAIGQGVERFVMRERLELARQNHQAGRLAEAQALYREALAEQS